MAEVSQSFNCLQETGGERCSAFAWVIEVVPLESTDGPVDHVNTLCIEGHRMFLSAKSLPTTPDPSEPDYNASNN